jgi:asparagine synthase (glutamine-hydrolysing)
MVDNIYRRCHVVMRDKYGWKLYKNGYIKIWFFGYQYNSNIKDILHKIPLMLNHSSTANRDILHWINGISGHFAIVVETNEWVIASVDKICTNPIFFVKGKECVFISNHAPMLKKECSMSQVDLDSLAELEISMSGYTIGRKTLYNGLERLEGGECLLHKKGLLYIERYYTYSPWKVKIKSEEEFKKEFTDVCIKTLIDLKNSIGKRQIVVPLSAGNDSRLIVSGFKELGVENVICFSYGRSGNFETPISQSISKKLGYKWIYLQVTMQGKRKFFKSDTYNEYVKDFLSYGCIPNVQEVYEISLLKLNPLVDDDAIIVNGNSGDFISGGHIRSISDIRYTPKTISGINWNKFLRKHYSLWGCLRTPINDSHIISELEKTLFSLNLKTTDFKKYHYAMMEYIEYVGRQSKIVIGQQRTYEYFGYDWRLPLWSDSMLTFWESVPYKYKVDQRLYIKTLRENNWGGVWLGIKVNSKIINPVFLRLLRIVLKFLLAPLGRSKWHRVEKNIFEYFMHPTYALAPISYFRILFDLKRYRSVNSWLSRKMLKKIIR